jgi:hypothetical protein
MINYIIWDLTDRFTAFEAACLWNDLDPDNQNPEQPPGRVSVMLRAIVERVPKAPKTSEEMKKTSSIKGWFEKEAPEDLAPYRVRYFRRNLLELANELGSIPNFLLPPEERTIANPEEDENATIDNKRRLNTWRRVVKILLIAAKLNASDSETVGKLQRIATDSGISLIDDETIRDLIRFAAEIDTPKGSQSKSPFSK